MMLEIKGLTVWVSRRLTLTADGMEVDMTCDTHAF